MHDINSESGTKADIEKRNESYNAYVKNVTPKGSCVAKCFKAFIVGGCICVAGQIILNVCKWMKVRHGCSILHNTDTGIFKCNSYRT